MLLKRLCDAPGLPGQEGAVRTILVTHLDESGVPWRTDTLGNVLVGDGQTGRGPTGCRKPRVMLCAHMDEIGLVVTGYERSGLLRFRAIGGVDERVLVAKRVRVGLESVPGVIGSKAVHLQETDEAERVLRADDLYIDIGAASREDAERTIPLGAGAVFDTAFEAFGSDLAKAKAFDDRAGCAIAVDITARLQALQGVDLVAAFTVQEEIGTRGAWVAAQALRPDLAVVLECTAAADTPGAKGHEIPTALGAGPALSFMDSGLVVNPRLLAQLSAAAESAGVTCQLRKGVRGGTDGGRVALARGGVPTVVISVPCRYIHSPATVLSLADFHSTTRLVEHYLADLGERGVLS